MSKGLKVRPEGSDTLNTGQVTLATGTAQAIITLTQNRRAILIVNTSTALPCYVGTSTISKTTGCYIGPNAALSIPTNAPVFGTVTDVAGVVVTYVEIL